MPLSPIPALITETFSEGKITVNLKGKEDRTQCERASRLTLGVIECEIHKDRAIVRDDEFFEEPPQHLAESIHGLVSLERPRVLELGKEMRGAFDGARDQLWKETHIRSKRDPVVGGPQFSSVHIDGIAERLEGVEADSGRKNPLKRADV